MERDADFVPRPINCLSYPEGCYDGYQQLPTRIPQLKLTPAEHAKIANLLANYVPAGGLNPAHEEEKMDAGGKMNNHIAKTKCW